MRKTSFLIFITVLGANIVAVSAQTNKIDILKSTFNTAVTPAEKADDALAICTQSYSLNNDTLYHYAALAKKMSADLKDPGRQTMADVYIEIYLTRRNLFDSTLKMCDADLKHLDYKSNSDAYAQTMIQKCNCLLRANRNTSALNVLFAFLAQSEKYG